MYFVKLFERKSAILTDYGIILLKFIHGPLKFFKNGNFLK